MPSKIDEQLSYSPIRTRGERADHPSPSTPTSSVMALPYSQACVIVGLRNQRGRTRGATRLLKDIFLRRSFSRLGFKGLGRQKVGASTRFCSRLLSCRLLLEVHSYSGGGYSDQMRKGASNSLHMGSSMATPICPLGRFPGFPEGLHLSHDSAVPSCSV